MNITFSLSIRLLDVIAGRKNPMGLKQGLVLVDGKVVTSELRLSSAYVVQVHVLKKPHNILMLFCLLAAFISVIIIPG